MTGTSSKKNLLLQLKLCDHHNCTYNSGVDNITRDAPRLRAHEPVAYAFFERSNVDMLVAQIQSLAAGFSQHVAQGDVVGVMIEVFHVFASSKARYVSPHDTQQIKNNLAIANRVVVNRYLRKYASQKALHSEYLRIEQTEMDPLRRFKRPRLADAMTNAIENPIARDAFRIPDAARVPKSVPLGPTPVRNSTWVRQNGAREVWEMPIVDPAPDVGKKTNSTGATQRLPRETWETQPSDIPFPALPAPGETRSRGVSTDVRLPQLPAPAWWTMHDDSRQVAKVNLKELPAPAWWTGDESETAGEEG